MWGNFGAFLFAPGKIIKIQYFFKNRCRKRQERNSVDIFLTE